MSRLLSRLYVRQQMPLVFMLGSKCLSSFLTYYHLNNHTIAIRIKNFQVCLDGNCCVWQIGGIFPLCAAIAISADLLTSWTSRLTKGRRCCLRFTKVSP